MISQIAEAISAFFYSMDVIDEEEKGKSRYGIEIIISTIRESNMYYRTMVLCS